MDLALGFSGAIVIGILLGLLGGGGSILAVPVFVYFFHESPVYATAYSLFVVGLTSFIGSMAFMRQGLVNLRIAFILGLPAVASVFLTRKFIIPAIPEELFTIADIAVTRGMGIMLLFSLLMIFAAVSMIKNIKPVQEAGEKKINYPLVAAEGIVVGVLTGLVGAGGGFLIIPVLVIFSGLPIKEAVGTSLLIIAMKSLIGFTGDITNLTIEWEFLLSFTAVAVLGIWIGSAFSKVVPSAKLKPAFGWFVLVMGIYIIGKEMLMI